MTVTDSNSGHLKLVGRKYIDFSSEKQSTHINYLGICTWH